MKHDIPLEHGDRCQRKLRDESREAVGRVELHRKEEDEVRRSLDKMALRLMPLVPMLDFFNFLVTK